MLVEEAKIIRDLLTAEQQKSVLNVCSSDERSFKMRQPWIWFEVMKPLLDRGCIIHNLDIKHAYGVDIVNDCTNMIDIEDHKYDIVLFFSSIEHIAAPSKALSEIQRVIKNDGLLYASAPGVYPRHNDPIDTMLRLSTCESWKSILGNQWRIELFRKTRPIPAKPSYSFKELVYVTVIRARKNPELSGK